MCDFFSFVTLGAADLKYFDWEQRQLILNGKLYSPNGQSIMDADSHSEICLFYGIDCDRVNKYEYNFLTKKFTIDQINNKHDDSARVKIAIKKLDVKSIVPIIIKKIVNPTKMRKRKISLEEAVVLLKEWASVWASVRASVRASVWDSVWDSVGDSVWASVRASVRDSVWASVRDSVWASVRDSVWASVRDSVWASVGAYCSSFFNIEYKYDFSSAIKLWEAGYVPTFDGEMWRLHGYKGKILWTGKEEDI